LPRRPRRPRGLHALSPLHAGQRAARVVTEIAVIVIGVMIARGEGRLLANWAWQRRVALVEVKLQGEAWGNVIDAAEQVAIGPCADAQLPGVAPRAMQLRCTKVDPSCDSFIACRPGLASSPFGTR
jgi:hypothetical protein